jgi:hypothetical protein
MLVWNLRDGKGCLRDVARMAKCDMYSAQNASTVDISSAIVIYLVARVMS